MGKEDHGIMEWFGWEGTFEGHLIQPPCHEQGHLHPDQVAQSPVQPGLECFQDGASTTSLGNLGQGFTALSINNFFLIPSLNLPSFILKPPPLVLSLQPLLKSLSPSFFQATFKYWQLLQGLPRAFSSPG